MHPILEANIFNKQRLCEGNASNYKFIVHYLFFSYLHCVMPGNSKTVCTGNHMFWELGKKSLNQSLVSWGEIPITVLQVNVFL